MNLRGYARTQVWIEEDHRWLTVYREDTLPRVSETLPRGELYDDPDRPLTSHDPTPLTLEGLVAVEGSPE